MCANNQQVNKRLVNLCKKHLKKLWIRVWQDGCARSQTWIIPTRLSSSIINPPVPRMLYCGCQVLTWFNGWTRWQCVRATTAQLFIGGFSLLPGIFLAVAVPTVVPTATQSLSVWHKVWKRCPPKVWLWYSHKFVVTTGSTGHWYWHCDGSMRRTLEPFVRHRPLPIITGRS